MKRAIHFLLLELLFLAAACTSAPTPDLAETEKAGIQTTPPAIDSLLTTAIPASSTPAASTPVVSGAFSAPVWTFAGDPNDPRGAYALLANYELYYTHDRGQTWQPLPFPPAGTGEAYPTNRESFPLVQPDLVAVAFQPGLLFARAGNNLYRSRDGGQTWVSLLDSVALFTVDYSGDEIYTWRPDLPRESRGLYHSRDGGETWTQEYQGLFPPALQSDSSSATVEGILSLAIDPAFGNGVFAGTYFGIFRSVSGGATWREFNTGLPLSRERTRRVPFISPDLYIITETTSEDTSRLMLAHMTHGQIQPDQDHWKEIGEPDLIAYSGPGLPGFYGVHDLLEREDKLYLATSSGLLVSYDQGEHWGVPGGGEGPFYRLGKNPNSPNQLYAWTDNGLSVVSLGEEAAGSPILPPMPPVSGMASLNLLGSAGGALKGFALLDKIAVLSTGIHLEVLDLSQVDGPRLIGRSELLPGLPEALTAVEREDQQAVYVAVPESGLLVFELSKSSQPVQVSSLALPFAPRILFSQEDRLYVTGGSCSEAGCAGGLAILDISVPTQPRLSGFLETPSQTMRLELAGETAYLYERDCQGGDCIYILRLVDVSNPAAPEELSALEVPGPLVNLIVVGNHVLLAHESGLLSFDVSQPHSPKQTGRIQFSYLNSFVIGDQVGYTTAQGRAQVIDLTDLSRPKLGSEFPQGQFPLINGHGAALYDQTIYFMDSIGEFGYCSTSLHVYDLTNPLAPLEVTKSMDDALWFTCGRQMSIHGNWLVLVDWKGIHFLDLSQPRQPRLYGSYNLASTYADLTVRDGYLYASNGLASDSLLVVDARKPAEPIQHGPFPFGFAWGVVSSGKHLYIPSWGSGLVIAEISDPARPVSVAGLGAESLGGYAYRVALDGDRLVVAVGEPGIRIVDISDPLNPVPKGSLDLTVGDQYIGADWLVAHEGYIYLITNLPKGDGSARPYLVVVDDHDPLNPTLVNHLELPDGFSPVALHFKDGMLLTAANVCPGGEFGCAGRVSIYDLTHAAEPVEISALEFPFELKAMTEADGFAYLSVSPDRLLMLDISTPDSLELAALFQSPGCTGNLAAESQRVYLAACDAGILILGVGR